MKKIILLLVCLCPLAQAATTQTTPSKVAVTPVKAADTPSSLPKTTPATQVAPTQTPPKKIVVCYKEAMALPDLTKCAEEGDANAQLQLGTMYHEGKGGVEKDYKKGFEMTLKAAHQSNSQAQYLVGLMFTRGSGTRLDYDKAQQWYTTAANQGNADAQRALGAVYYKAEGVRRDYVASYMWLNLAAMQGDAAALKFRDTVIKKLTPEQLTRAHQMTADWQAKYQQKQSISPTPPASPPPQK